MLELKTKKLELKPDWSKGATIDLSKHGICFMPHHNPLCDFPCSRDYELDQIVCKATKCVANREGFCIAPSLCEIGEDGRCINYKERK